MKRSYFFKIISMLLVGFSLLGFSDFSAKQKQSDLQETFSQLRTFIIQDLGINLSESFYSVEAEGYQYYLYLSEKKQIKRPENEPYFRFFGSDSAGAEAAFKKYSSKKYHAMLYHTAATSAAKIYSPLSDYPTHCLSFIAFHEAHHIHRKSGDRKPIPYSLEEAAGDVLGNYASIQFAKKHPEFMSMEAVKHQIALNENLYTTINATRKNIDDGKNAKKEFLKLQKFLEKTLQNEDKFKRDRFLYPVNNAYFIRYGYYTANYFLLRDLYVKTGSAKAFLAFLDQLPEEETAAIQQIKNYLQS